MTPTIVFDLDGTLVDSARDLAASASELVQELGGRPLDVSTVVPMVGEGAPVLVQRALLHEGLDPMTPGALDRFLAIYDRRLLEHTTPYEGIVEVLAMLIRLGRLAVLTNKPTGASEHILERLGLRGFFSEIIGGDGAHGRKPDPTGLQVLLARTGAGVMVGDSPADANTARAVPCPFLLAAYGFGVAKFGSDVPACAGIARHPRELVSLIETLTFDAARVPIVMR